MKILRLPAALSALVALTACDPSFETTGNICASGSTTVVRAAFNDFSFDLYDEADNPTTEYKPLLEDIFTAMNLADGEMLEDDATDTEFTEINDNPLSAADKQAVLDELKTILRDRMGYTFDGDRIASIENPTEFIGYLAAIEDPDDQIGIFQQAKNQAALGINNNDDYCSFTNTNIRFDKYAEDDPHTRLETIAIDYFNMFYSPFEKTLDQAVRTIFLTNPDEDESLQERLEMDSASFMDAAIFNQFGYTEPDIRRSTELRFDDNETRILIEDRYTNKLKTVLSVERDHIGIVEYEKLDVLCDEVTDDDGNVSYCEDSDTTRVITKAACLGGENDLDEAWETIDLTDRIRISHIDLNGGANPRLQGIKRIAIETDYDAEETRVYVSKYHAAIRDSDGSIIQDPTNCEVEVVRDELQDLVRQAGDDTDLIDALGDGPNGNDGANIIPQHILDRYKASVAAGDNEPLNVIVVENILDPFYDFNTEFEYDDDGNVLLDDNGDPEIREESDPVPLIVFQGVALPERKTPSEE